jgi:hypothetical protein
MHENHQNSYVVVCTRNRNTDLQNAFDSFKRHGGNRVFVCVDSSDEHIFVQNQRIFTNYKNVKHMKSNPGLTKQRNLALEILRKFPTSQQTFVHFIDDDVIIESEYFDLLEKVLRDPDIAGATGLDLNLSGTKFSCASIFLGLTARNPGTFSRFGIPRFHTEDSGLVQNVQWLSGCSMSFDLKKISGFVFDERLQGYGLAEDVWFTFALSRQANLVFQPAAQFRHFKSELNRLGDYDRNLCEKSHRRIFLQENSNFFEGGFRTSVLIELLLNLLKLLTSGNHSQYFPLLKSGLAVLWLTRKKESTLVCKCLRVSLPD